MKKIIITLLLIIGLCANISAQRQKSSFKPSNLKKSSVITPKNIDFAAPTTTPSTQQNAERNSPLEQTGKIDTSAYRDLFVSETTSQTEQENIDVVNRLQKLIYDYYGSNTFNEYEWIRVRVFMTFLKDNEKKLNSLFNKRYKKYYYKLPSNRKDILIAAFAGANFLTKKFNYSGFDLKISVSNACEAISDGTICVSSDDIIEAIDISIHEATHVLKFVEKREQRNRTYQETEFISEKNAILSQIWYGLPVKLSGDNILRGTRAWFQNKDKDFIEQHYEEILLEYAEIVLAISEYNRTPKRDSHILVTVDDTSTISEVLSSLSFIQISNDLLRQEYGHNSSDIDSGEFVDVKFIQDYIYKQMTAKTVEFFNSSFSDKSVEEKIDNFDNMFYEWFENNKIDIAKIIFDTIKENTPRNIYPIPQGYI